MSDMSVKISGYSTGEKINLVNDSQNRQATVINRHDESTREINPSLIKDVVVDVDNDGRYKRGFDNVLMVKLPEPTDEERTPTKAERRDAKIGGIIFGTASGSLAGFMGGGLIGAIAGSPKVALVTGTVIAVGTFIAAYKSETNEEKVSNVALARATSEISKKVPNFVSPKD